MSTMSRRLFISTTLITTAAAFAGCSSDRSSLAGLLEPSASGRRVSGQTISNIPGLKEHHEAQHEAFLRIAEDTLA